MNKLVTFSLFLLLLAPVVHAGLIEDVFDGIGGFFHALAQGLFGVPKPDSESVCIERVLVSYSGYLLSSAQVPEAVALNAYSEFVSCKETVNVAGYSPNCIKKDEISSYCPLLKKKCDSSTSTDERFTAAKAAGGCFIAENMCKDALKKNFAECKRRA